MEEAASLDLKDLGERLEAVAGRNKQASLGQLQRTREVGGNQDQVADLGGSSSSPPARPYERRARHKTRHDKYESKPEKGQRKETAAKDRRPSRRQKGSMKKSGAALMHDFDAPNVARDRLTVGHCP